MQFKHPEFLYALVTVLIPILIHLFQLRKFKRIEFTNVQLLKEVKLQTRKSSQLKKWLTLLARMLAISCIVIAFAQPYNASFYQPSQIEETVIYLDNSSSMQAKGAKGSLLNQAIQDLLTHIPEDKNITLFTNTKVYRDVKISNIRDQLLNLSFTSGQLPYNSVFQKGTSLFSNDSSTVKQLLLISDFQNNEVLPKNKNSSNLKTTLIQLQPNNYINKSIDSVYLSRNKDRELFVNAVISTTEKEISTIPVAAYNDTKLIGKTTIPITNLKSAVANFKIEENQLIKGKIVIDDNSLTFDNFFYFTINPVEKIKVTAIQNKEESTFLQRIFTNDEFELTVASLRNFDYNLLETSNLLILNELKDIPVSLSNAIQSFVSKGGSFCLVPASNADLASYNQLLDITNLSLEPFIETEQKITSINYDHPLYEGVFDRRVTNFQYPKVNSYYRTNASNTILSFAGNQPFLVHTGNSYIFTAPLNQKNSNFQNSPLIVPTFYNIAKQSLKTGTLFYTIGKNNSYDISTTLKGDQTLTLTSEKESIIPLQQSFSNKIRITTQENPEKSGIYQVTANDRILQYTAYNYSAAESLMEYYNTDQFSTAYATDIGATFDRIKQDFEVQDLWKWFVIFALLFLSIEILLLKFLP